MRSSDTVDPIALTPTLKNQCHCPKVPGTSKSCLWVLAIERDRESPTLMKPNLAPTRIKQIVIIIVYLSFHCVFFHCCMNVKACSIGYPINTGPVKTI